MFKKKFKASLVLGLSFILGSASFLTSCNDSKESSNPLKEVKVTEFKKTELVSYKIKNGYEEIKGEKVILDTDPGFHYAIRLRVKYVPPVTEGGEEATSTEGEEVVKPTKELLANDFAFVGSELGVEKKSELSFITSHPASKPEESQHEEKEDYTIKYTVNYAPSESIVVSEGETEITLSFDQEEAISNVVDDMDYVIKYKDKEIPLAPYGYGFDISTIPEAKIDEGLYVAIEYDLDNHDKKNKVKELRSYTREDEMVYRDNVDETTDVIKNAFEVTITPSRSTDLQLVPSNFKLVVEGNGKNGVQNSGESNFFVGEQFYGSKSSVVTIGKLTTKSLTYYQIDGVEAPSNYQSVTFNMVFAGFDASVVGDSNLKIVMNI